MTRIDRRTFVIAGFAGLVAARAGAGESRSIPIIDTHIHLFDPNRPQGVPYAGPPNSPVGKTGAFPEIYQKLAEPAGIVGAIEIEASPWVEDNLWVLQVAEGSKFIVGKIGNLNPDSKDFNELFDRFSKNPLFRGIRYGNIWGYDLPTKSREPTFLTSLKRVADAGLVLDTANQNIEMLEAAVRVSDAVPDLRIVLDHLPAFVAESEDVTRYVAVLNELRDRPQIYCKISAVIREIDGTIRRDLAPHKARLEQIYDAFGEDRVLFGSDWPNSDGVAPFNEVVQIVKNFFASKPRRAQEKYFWQNSVHAYKWVRRTQEQPTLAS
ncbi:MAG TPA: amidohydrolase family protein [Woeseiaceae bacterium]|nr:amidohydrolase family protein [Woeseiaceae bacterium]